MHKHKNIENATVLNYCLGLLSNVQKIFFEKQLSQDPELLEEVESIRGNINDYIVANINKPNEEMKDKIWETLENVILEDQMDPLHLPLINKFTDYTAWLKAVAPILDRKAHKNQFMHLLPRTDNVIQVLIMANDDIPEEIHDDMQESFIILEGECECHVGNKVIRLKAGGFLEIPLHEHHDVKVISDSVVAIVQRIPLAA